MTIDQPSQHQLQQLQQLWKEAFADEDAFLDSFFRVGYAPERCRCLTLEVRESNAPAIALYEKCGFVFCGIRKDYYTDPKENALLMRLAFDGTQEYEEWDDDE